MRRRACRGVVFGLLAPCLAPAQTPSTPIDDTVERVEVVGSSIRRAGTAAPMTVLNADDLARAGVSTAAQALRRIAAHQPEESPAQMADEVNGGVSEANLRGLGSDKTLVLLNGRRLANHAYSAGTVDLNALPMAAIDRIEVLREGASATYGSGAVAGVVNFVLKRDVAGLQMALESEAPDGAGGDVARASLLAGFATPQGHSAMVALDHRRQRAIAGADRSFSKSGVMRRPDGSLQFLTSGSSFPGDLDGYEPSLTAGCAPPRSIPSQDGRSCRYDYVADIDLVPASEQTTVLGQANVAFGPSLIGTLEYLHASNKTLMRQTPTATRMRLPDTSPYWIVGRPVTNWDGPGQGGIVDWLVAPAGLRTLESRSSAQRLLAGLQGRHDGTDFQAGVTWSDTSSYDTLMGGYLHAGRLQQGLMDGRINPFGRQTASGQTAIDAAQLRGRLVQAEGAVLTADARASRALMPLHGGALTLTVGAEATHERFAYEPQPLAADNAAPELEFAVPTRGSRRTAAVYGELLAPLASGFNAHLAVRQDNYSDSGGYTSPKLGFSWQAASTLLLRGSVTRGFRAPTLYEIHLPQRFAVTGDAYDDPLLCPDGNAVPGASASVVCEQQLLRRYGGVASYGKPASALQAETSRGLNLGLVVEPLPRTTVALDFWSLALNGEIDELDEGAIIEQPDRYASRIVRCSALGASQRAGIGVCSHYPAMDPIAFVDTPIENLGDIRTRGVDLSVAWRSGGGAYGELQLALDGTYIAQYDYRSERGVAFTPTVGRYANDLPIFRWQHVLQANWVAGAWNTALSQRYMSGYVDQNEGNRVASYTLHDLSISYAGFDSLVLTAGVKNLFDRNPPYSNQDETLQRNFDPRFTDPTGRAWMARVEYTFR